MAPEYSGRGDAVRSMELLWGGATRGARGPKPGTDLPTIVRAAIELADADGLDAVSMRKVAQKVGLSTMALYSYVPGKGELLDLMLDTAYADQPRSPVPPPGSTRESLEALARGQWAFFHRHPWTLSIASSRAALGPNELDGYEAALAAVADLGITARDAVAIVDALSIFVRGAAREAVEAADAERVTGMSELEWWRERDRILTGHMTDERFPTLGRLGAAGGFDVPPDTEHYNLTFIVQDFEFGLQRLLDGVEAYLARSRRGRSRRKAASP